MTIENTHCFELWRFMHKGLNLNNERAEVKTLHYTVDGLVAVVVDKTDGQEYEITIKPKGIL